jgi:hypothetical protein
MFQKKAAAATTTDANPAMAACDAAIKGFEFLSSRAHKSLNGKASPSQLTAFDSAIAGVKVARAKIGKKRKVPTSKGIGMDAATQKVLASLSDGTFMKGAIQHVALRDKLAKRVSAFVGTFDASEMTMADVAKYAMDKFELKAPAGQEVAAVEAYLHNRQPDAPRRTFGFGLDAAPKPDKTVTDYLASN